MVTWSAGEIETAKSKCKKLLEGATLEYELLPPIKEGVCGAPAPILVKSIGEPKVVIEPAATLTCRLASNLARWLSEHVQPEATAQFGARVVKLRNVSSYVCRKRNGGPEAPLSEHALANALDISAFVLKSGEEVAVLEGWPRAVASEPPVPKPNPVRPTEITGAIPLPEPKPPIPVSRVKATEKANIAAPPPPLAVEPQQRTPLSEREAHFLKDVHDAACQSFGTVLGPDADEAHKNHFHLDMKPRRHSSLCQ